MLDRLILLAVLLCGVTNATAEEAAQPRVAVGDRWSYEVRDLLTGNVKWGFTRTVYNVTDAEIHQKVEFKSKSRISRVEILDRNLNLLDNGLTQWEPHSGNFQFPLKVGKSWQLDFNSRAISREMRSRHQLSATVAALEKIKVPAGEFSTYRIDIEVRSFSTSDNERADGRTLRKVWYSPEVRQIVREENEVMVAKRVREKTAVELTEYSFKP